METAETGSKRMVKRHKRGNSSKSCDKLLRNLSKQNNINISRTRNTSYNTIYKVNCIAPVEEPDSVETSIALLDYWGNTLQLSQNMDPDTRAYKQAQVDLENLLDGFHPNFRDRKFQPNEITWAMDQFATMVHDKTVAPANKSNVKKINVSRFIYNHFAKRVKSYLAILIDGSPQPLPKVKKDINPDLTDALIRIWRREMLHGLTYNMGKKEKQDFIDASHKITKFLEENNGKIQWLMLRRGASDIAEVLWKSIEHSTNYNLGKVTTYWLSSDLTLRKFFEYMAQKGYVKPTNEWRQ